MALGRMTKSMSGMGGVKQQMPVAPPAPAPKKRSVLSRARAPAVVPKQPQSNLERALTRQQYAPAQPQPAVAPTRPQATTQPYGPSTAEIQKQASPQQLAELQKQNPSGLSQIQPAPANSPSKPTTSVSKQSPNLSPYNASQQGAMNQFNQMAAFNQQQADAQKQFTAMANAPKMPAMRKGGAVKKKPGYAKGGMVMANCGASMKPQQQQRKK